MDYASVTPIGKPVPSNKQAAKRHYGTHPYFTRRSWDVVQAYIARFTDVGDLVLDPYGGSGVTAVEALITGRRAIHIDIAPLANFITDCIATAPLDLVALTDAFDRVGKACKTRLLEVAALSDADAGALPVDYWYPRGVRLPANADVDFVDELFTPKQLYSLAMLRHHIMLEMDPQLRKMLLFAFSGTLAKTNRTFVSATGRKESRGGSTIFSIYRYYIPPQPVELDVWPQFDMRFRSLLTAKKETNALIDGRYTAENFTVLQGSATELSKYVAEQSIDYIFTDPPYGSHIAYLDLTRMWDAWLGFPIRVEDRQAEVIEGGEWGKSKAEYSELLERSIGEMARAP